MSIHLFTNRMYTQYLSSLKTAFWSKSNPGLVGGFEIAKFKVDKWLESIRDI